MCIIYNIKYELKFYSYGLYNMYMIEENKYKMFIIENVFMRI